MSHQIRLTRRKINRRLNLIGGMVYRRRQPLPDYRHLVLAGVDATPPVDAGVDDSEWTILQPNTYWARRYENFVLRTRFRFPSDWDKSLSTVLNLSLGNARDFLHPEALAYIDGVPYATTDRYHTEILLPEQWLDGETHLLALHGYAGAWHAEWGLSQNEQFQIGASVIAQVDQPTRDFIVTARIALGAAVDLNDSDPVKSYLLNGLDEAFRILDTRHPLDERFYASVPQAHAALRDWIDRAGAPLPVDILAAGHAHIDIAWLWTYAQTRRKAGRTFYNVIRLMEQFPDYAFTQSQPQLYDFVRQDYPELFDLIKSRVAEGRWEAIGGMWVEADCNLSGGESLARQLLLGRGFYREHFGKGVASPVLWLPDVFGYAWNLPQLVKEANLEYFFTIKLGWNQYNRLPYDSFWWQGLDGTRVLTHFSTTPEPGGIVGKGTYNAEISARAALGTWLNFQQKEAQRELFMSYGYGDGGGGPNRDMLENLRELANFPAMPRMKPGRAIDFFRRLEATSGDKLPVWNGELYLEFHRGTYTTQSRTKRANRKCEFLLHDAEFLATLAARLDPEYAYPEAEFERAWKLVCLNQFHDVLPGSSIQPVYADALELYSEVETTGAVARSLALRTIAATIGGDVLVANPTSFTRADLALYSGDLPEGQTIAGAGGALVPVQPTAEGILFAPGALPPYSVTPFVFVPGVPEMPDTGLRVAPDLLENDFLRVELNPAGDITRIYDKANGRDVLPPGALANQFQAFEDRPLDFDAWDIDVFYDDKMWMSDPAESIEVVESGSLRVALEIRRRILNSDYLQRISLDYHSPRLNFDTTIHWRERHILLKVAFPVDVLSPAATFEVQWGNVQRPTHRNTSWDWARFETCAHKWVDLSEGDYGVSLLNDCKYGHDIHDSVIRLSLLRSPTFPDPEADQGEHRFAYSLLPHAGNWGADTIASAYALNDPLIVAEGENTPPTADAARSLLQVDRDNVVIETVKHAEDGDGIIVRLYECRRQRGMVTLTADFPIAAAYRTNLLEDNQTALDVQGNAVRFPIKPYQIITLRLLPA